MESTESILIRIQGSARESCASHCSEYGIADAELCLACHGMKMAPRPQRSPQMQPEKE